MFLRTFFILPVFFALTIAYNLSISANGGNVSSPLMYGLMFEDINQCVYLK